MNSWRLTVWTEEWRVMTARDLILLVMESSVFRLEVPPSENASWRNSSVIQLHNSSNKSWSFIPVCLLYLFHSSRKNLQVSSDIWLVMDGRFFLAVLEPFAPGAVGCGAGAGAGWTAWVWVFRWVVNISHVGMFSGVE